MPTHLQFDYAIVRLVPKVERGEFINVGVILFCRTRRFLEVHFDPDWSRLAAFTPDLDTLELGKHFEAMSQICKGGIEGGYIGQLSQAERYHWLVAPRSTIIQTSPSHSGLCLEPEAELQILLNKMVRP